MPSPPPDPVRLPAFVDHYVAFLKTSLEAMHVKRRDRKFLPSPTPKECAQLHDELGDLLDKEDWTAEETLRLSAIFFAMTLISGD